MGRHAQMEHWLSLREREGLTYRELSERSGIPSNTLAGSGAGLAEVARLDSRRGCVELRQPKTLSDDVNHNIVLHLKFADDR